LIHSKEFKKRQFLSRLLLYVQAPHATDFKNLLQNVRFAGINCKIKAVARGDLK
jgi:hypothetical protein